MRFIDIFNFKKTMFYENLFIELGSIPIMDGEKQWFLL